MQERKAEEVEDASNQQDGSVATIQPPLRSRSSGGSGLLLSLLLSAAYVGIASAACLFAWRHLVSATSSSVLSRVCSPTPSTDLFPPIGKRKEGHKKWTAHRLVQQTQTKPDHEKNRMAELAFTMLSISLHVSLQSRLSKGIAGWLILLLTPAVLAAKFVHLGRSLDRFPLWRMKSKLFGLSASGSGGGGGVGAKGSNKQAAAKKSKKTQ